MSPTQTWSGPVTYQHRIRWSRSATLVLLVLAVSRIKKIQNPHRFGEQRVVVARLLLDSLENGFQALRIGDRNAAHVEVVHGCTDCRECGIPVQAEARE